MEDPGPPYARRPPREDSARPGDRMALGSVLIGGLLAAVFVAARLAFSGSEPQIDGAVLGLTATDQPVHVQVGAQPSPASSVQAGAQPSPVNAASPVAASPVPASASGGAAHIANTDGQGVVLRASPREDDRTPRGFFDGDSVTVLERSGAEWVRVRGDNGQEGWVPSKYLGP